MAATVLEKLPELKNSQAHATKILNQKDQNAFATLGIITSCEPQ